MLNGPVPCQNNQRKNNLSQFFIAPQKALGIIQNSSEISITIRYHSEKDVSVTLRKKYAYSELLWSSFSRIRFEYEEKEIRRIFLIQSECRKMRTRINPNTDTFYTVLILEIAS